MSTLRRKMERVAAARGCGPAAVAWSCVSWSRTSAGQGGALLCYRVNGGLQGCEITLFGCHTAEFKLRGEVVRLDREDLLHQLLEARITAGIALALNLRGELIKRAHVVWILRDRLLQVRNGCSGVAALAFEQAPEVIDLIVVRRERVRMVQAVGSGVVVALAHGEDAPVDPRCGFACGEPGALGEAGVRADVIADLQACKTDVEGRDELLVRLATGFRYSVLRVTADYCQREQRGRRSSTMWRGGGSTVGAQP